MKRATTRLLTPLQRLASRAGRPLARKLDGHVDAAVHQVIQAHVTPALSRLESSVAGSARAARSHEADVNLALNSLIREVARLQSQVETLQAALQDEP